jgi:hypothetical protein
MDKQAIFEAVNNITVSLQSLNGLRAILNNGPIGIKSLYSEPIGNKEDHQEIR